MRSSPVVEQVTRVADTCAAPDVGRAEITAAMRDLARIESWTAARRAELVGRLSAQPGSFPEADIADTTGCTLNAAVKETERAAMLAAAGSFADALDTGDIRPGHVDALTRAAKNLTDDQSAVLLDSQAELAAVAAVSSIREFDKHLAAQARALQTDADAEARLQRQRRATRAHSCVDPADGMWCLSARLDPQTGVAMQRALDDAVTSLFAESTPDTAPRDPRERQQHLTGLALTRLIGGDAPTRTRPGDPIVVVDATTATPVSTSSRRTNIAPTADVGSDPATGPDVGATAAAGPAPRAAPRAGAGSDVASRAAPSADAGSDVAASVATSALAGSDVAARAAPSAAARIRCRHERSCRVAGFVTSQARNEPRVRCHRERSRRLGCG